MQTLSLNTTSLPSPASQSRDVTPFETPQERTFSASRSHRSNSNFQKLPPLITSPARRSNTPRPLSQVSQSDKFFSAITHVSGPRTHSRPHSTVFPAFHSTLEYSVVRDFAYPPDHPLHYGPPPEPSRAPSPDPIEDEDIQEEDSYGETKGDWYHPPRNNSERPQSGPRLPATSYNDGPPWSEDEDLLSPIVTTSKHKRGKSSFSDMGRSMGRNKSEIAPENVVMVSAGRRHSADDVSHGRQLQTSDATAPEPSSYFALDRDAYADASADFASDDEASPISEDEDQSRYSRDYQFTIASPDEEMHGKAVALFDFARENDNELPLLEGQVLWVSYRHGQGWLVAQDPKSGESGLVPEEYVRLLRDIEGGLNRLQGVEGSDWEASPTFNMSSGDSPMSAFHERTASGTSGQAGNWVPPGDGGTTGQHYTPVQSHFSTSSKDLERYPAHHLLAASQSQAHANASQGPASPASPAWSSPGEPTLKAQAYQHGEGARLSTQQRAQFSRTLPNPSFELHPPDNIVAQAPEVGHSVSSAQRPKNNGEQDKQSSGSVASSAIQPVRFTAQTTSLESTTNTQQPNTANSTLGDTPAAGVGLGITSPRPS